MANNTAVYKDMYGNEVVADANGNYHLKDNPSLLYVSSGGKSFFADSGSGKLYDGQAIFDNTEHPDNTADRDDGGFLDNIYKNISDSARGFLKNLDEEEQQKAKEAYEEAVKYIQPNYYLAKDTDADRNAQMEEAAGALGMDPDILRHASEDVQDAALRNIQDDKDDKTIDDMTKDNPLTTMYLSDDDNLARSHDDVPTLQWIENSGRQISNALELADAAHKLNDIDYKAKMDDKDFEELDATTRDERKHLIAKINYLKQDMPTNLLSAFGLAKFAGDIYQNAKAGGLGGAIGGAALGSAFPIIGTASGAAIGAQAGMALDAGQQAAGEKYREELSKGVDKEGAIKGATLSQLANTAIALPIINRLGSSLKTVFKFDKDGIIKRLIANTAEQAFLGGAMGVTDVEASRFAEGKGLLDDYSKAEKETVANNAVSMAEIGALMAVPGFGFAALGKIRNAVESSNTIKRGEVGKKAMEQFVDTAAPIDSEVDAGVLNAKIADLSDEDKKDTFSVLGITPEDLQAEAEHGGTVKITSGQFATLPKATAEALYPEVRVEGKPSAHEVVDREEHGESVEDDATPVAYDNGPDMTEEEYNKFRDSEVDKATANLKETVPQEQVFKAREALENDGMSGRFGESMTADKIIEDYNNDKLSPEAETKLDEFARERGYANADVMIKDMEKHPSVDEEIQKRTEAFKDDLDKRYGYDEDSKKIRDSSGDEAVNQILEEAADMEDDLNETKEKDKAAAEKVEEKATGEKASEGKEPPTSKSKDAWQPLWDTIGGEEGKGAKGTYALSHQNNGLSRRRNRAIARAAKLSNKAKAAGDTHTGLLFDLQLFGHKAAGEAEKGVKALKDAEKTTKKTKGTSKKKVPMTEDERLNKRLMALKSVDATSKEARKLLGVVEPLFSKAGLRLSIRSEKEIHDLRVKLKDLQGRVKSAESIGTSLLKDKARLEKNNAKIKQESKESQAQVKAAMKEKYDAKLAEKDSKIYEIKMTSTWAKGELESMVKSMDSIIKDLVKETKDSKILQEARTFHWKKGEMKQAKDRIHWFMNGLRMSSSADYRRFRRDAERCHRIAERHYRRAMRGPAWGNKEGHGLINWRKQVQLDPSGHVIQTLADRGNEAAAAFNARYQEIQTALKWKRREAMAKLMEQRALKIFDHKRTLERQIIHMAHAKLAANGDMVTKYQVSKLVQLFGFDTKPDSSTSRYIKQFEADNPNKVLDLKQWIDEVNGDGADLTLSDEFIKCIGKNWEDLTPVEADEVFNTIRQVQKAGKNARTMYTEGNKRLVEDERTAQIDEMNQRPRTHSKSEEAVKMDSKRLDSKSYIDDQKTMDTIVSSLAHEGSRLYNFWIKKVHLLADQESNALNRFLNGYDIVKDGKKIHVDGYKDIYKAYSPIEKWKMGRKLYHSDVLGCDMTKSQMLTLLMNMGSEENRAKLFGGIINNQKVEGRVPVEFEDKITDPSKWTYENVLDFIGQNMDKRDIQTVQKVWDLLGEMWPKLKEKEFERTGKLPKSKLAAPLDITLKDGTEVTMTGGYYPLARHQLDYVKDKQIQENVGLSQLLRTDSFGHGTTVQGFLKQVTSKEYAVSLNPSVLTTYITDAIHDYYFRDWVADAYRIWNDGSFKDALFSHGGDSYRVEFYKYMNSVAGSDYRQMGAAAVNDFAVWVKRNVSSASIAFNIGVITQNLANCILYPGAVDGWGAKDAARALIKYGMFYYWPQSIMFRSSEIARHLSPMMRDLLDRPDATLRNFQDLTFGRGMTGNNIVSASARALQDQVVQFSGHLMWFTDSLTSVPMWLGAHEKFLRVALSKGMSQAEAEKEAMFKADMLIRRVNGSPRRQDLSQFMQGKPSDVYGFFNTFMGFFNTEANRWFREKQRAGKLLSFDNIKNKPRFLAFVASRVLVFEMASNLLMGKTPDEDNPLGNIISDAIQYPFSMFPVLKDVGPAFNAWFGLDTMGYRPPIQFSLFSDMNAAAKSVGKLATSDSRGKKLMQEQQKAVESVMRFGGDITGFPRSINNLFFNAVDYDNNVFNDFGFEDTFHRHHNKKKKPNQNKGGIFQ